MGKNRYGEIVDTLAVELARLSPGTRVASEHEIAARFGVSRAAARAAVQELESRLLVRRVRGSGTFVSRRIDYVISSRKAPSWHQTVRDAGGTPRAVVRDVRREPLPEDLAERLERRPGDPAHLLVRQYYVDGLLATWTNEWIPADVLMEADAAVHSVESIDLILRQMAGVAPVRAWCRVSFDLATPEVAANLEIEQGRQVWLVESVSRDAQDGTPVMCSNSWSRPDASRIVVEMDGPWPSAKGQC
ncbi:GntR family transcriptional regulator [Streptantibioticus ferralitis]|uniref:GntR family transcriptional regulator n=1 Tax=Streptantibioticus ferralitis TaxID=236510 RepID=A0ABT5YZH1_9ACTN|nr:GntR family transcriptional regulator [Streptantibioticus ferralitis]MDF2257001.1 GntR family transcriptional regulator [Streptantibioticus ferralitis]